MDNACGLIAGVRKERMRDDVEEQFGKKKKRHRPDRWKGPRGKVNNTKGANLTARPLLNGSWVHAGSIQEYEALGELKSQASGGNPNDWLV